MHVLVRMYARACMHACALALACARAGVYVFVYKRVRMEFTHGLEGGRSKVRVVVSALQVCFGGFKRRRRVLGWSSLFCNVDFLSSLA